ncbi:MAG TPA: pimeloyl-ACP methyl ester esterase BioH [Burkholderiales bacterium]|nr:pimeloyl-ACP methyl ester esterase BioH [Burkholderiales bacterium]
MRVTADPKPETRDGGLQKHRVKDVVLLHGWGITSGIWKDLAAPLATQYRVHAWELPGYGASPACSPYTLDAMVGVLAQAAPERCQVVGWSLGGLVALAWARAAPQQAMRLALIAATPCFTQRADWPQAVEADVLTTFARDLARNRRRTLQRFASLQARGDSKAAEVTRRLRAALAAGDEADAGALDGGLEILLETDLRQELASITQQALVVHGDRDELVPLAAAGYLARRLPAARLVVLHGAAHAPFLSQPRATAAVLREFLDD